HGFESVHHTIDQNFEQLLDVFGRYGLELSRSAARREAEKIREARGWKGEEANQPQPASGLRLVG
ncbi:MAG: hypothetical protein V3T07_05530, partial [Myxococcota bacterium]